MKRTINLYRAGPDGLTFWPQSAGDDPVFRGLVAGELVRYDDHTGRIVVRFRRRGVVAIGPVAFARLVRLVAPGFRPWEDRLPEDLSPFEGPARRRPRDAKWAIFLVPSRPGLAMRCVSYRERGMGRTTFSARYALRFGRKSEALARLAELESWGLLRPHYRYLAERL